MLFAFKTARYAKISQDRSPVEHERIAGLDVLVFNGNPFRVEERNALSETAKSLFNLLLPQCVLFNDWSCNVVT